MRYSQLKAFHHVAVNGGFSRAADALNLTQPAISDQVRKLEQAYDIRLFERSKRQVSLTQQGQELLKITRRLFEIEDEARELLAAQQSRLVGELRVIADSAYHITEYLTRFRALYPRVNIKLRTGNSSDVIAAVKTYDAEIGVLGNMRQQTEIHSIPFGSSPIIAFAAKGIATTLRPGASLANIAKFDLVMREQGSKTRQKLEEAGARQGVLLKANIEAEGREAVHEIVASGAGIGFVSAAEFGQDARLHRFNILGEPIQMIESIVCLKRRKDVRLIRNFLDIVSESKGQGVGLSRREQL